MTTDLSLSCKSTFLSTCWYWHYNWENFAIKFIWVCLSLADCTWTLNPWQAAPWRTCISSRWRLEWLPVMNDATEQVLILNCRLLSFFLSNPDFQPPSFVFQHPVLSLKLLEKRMRCYCTCPLVSTKRVCFRDRTGVYKILFKNETFFIHWGTGAVASCYSGKIYIVLEILEGRRRLRACCRFESGFWVVTCVGCGTFLVLFCFRVLLVWVSNSSY